MSEKSEHIEALDGLRGTAAMLVLLAHSTEHGLLLAHGADAMGAVGVTIFFTLSGFLMAYLYSSAPLTGSSLFRYGVNRFSRIAPLYLLAIIISYLIVKLVDHAFIYQINNGNIIRHLLFAGNVEVFWSIPPECQLYVFFILFWWVSSRDLKGQRLPWLILFLVSLIMFIVGPHLPGTSLPSKYGFFIGGALAGLLRQRLKRPSISSAAVSLSQLALFACVVSYPAFAATIVSHKGGLEIFGADIYFSPVYIALTTALVYAMSLGSGWICRCFSLEFMRRLGYWSFSIYILHDPMIYLATSAVGKRLMNPVVGELFVVVTTLVLAAVVHKQVEAPLQKLIKSAGAKVETSRLIKFRGV